MIDDNPKNLKRSDVLVVYASKYGTTKRYAQWIAESLSTEAFDLKRFSIGLLQSCSTVIFGSSVHIGKIKNVNFIKKNWELLSDKQIIVFASTGNPKITTKDQAVLKASLPSSISQNIHYFPLPGAYDYHKLDFTDKFLMNFGPMRNLRIKALIRGDEKAKEQLEALHQAVDWTNKEAITPILTFN